MNKDRSQSQFESVASLLPPIGRTAAPPVKVRPSKTPKQGRKFALPTDTAFDNPQMSLFQNFLCNNEEQQDALSNAIDLWDSVPRYSVSHQAMKKARIDGEFLRPHEMTFQHRGRTYTRIIHAARISDDDGQSRDYYPSATEELIEDALRKMAAEQQAGYFERLNYRSGVVFTLYALREEMKKRTHTRSFQEIVRSLHILARSVIEIKTEGGGEGFDESAYFPRLSAVSRTKLKDDPDAKWLVQFHPLVTGSIDQLTYRQYNYGLMMSHDGQLTRWLHKQLALKFTFADYQSRFEMRYSTVKRDSGLLSYGRNRDNVEALEKAYAELRDQGVISDFKRKDETGLRGKLLDVVFTVTPHLNFIRETKAANKRLSDARPSDGTSVGPGRGSEAKSVGPGRGLR
jgi:hypothetical protein